MSRNYTFGEIIRCLLKIVAPVLILAIGAGAAFYFIKTRPQVRRAEVEIRPTLVQVMISQKSAEQVRVEAMGIVIPAQKIALQPQVSGRIVELHSNLVAGGQFAEGETLLKIDTRDYELALEQRKAQHEKAIFDYKLEEGRQVIAQREFEEVGIEPKDDASRDLALRKPHLNYFRAAVTAAKSAVEEVELNLERTTIRAPFNSLVLDENIDVGQLVTPQTRIATLVGTDQYWIQVSIPVEHIRWMHIPGVNGEKGSLARIVQTSSNGTLSNREGKVIRLLGDLEPVGRMARVVIAVDDPLGLRSKDTVQLPLLLDAFVRVEIIGRTVSDVFVLPRTVLHNGTQVWIMDSSDTLALRTVHIVWSEKTRVFIDEGLEEGDRIVTSRIPAPVVGMPLKIQEE